MLNEQQMKYEWLTTIRGADVVVWMDLELSIDYEPGFFSVNRLLKATPSKIGPRPGSRLTAIDSRDYPKLCVNLTERFWREYSDYEIDDDVQDAACEQFGRRLHESAA